MLPALGESLEFSARDADLRHAEEAQYSPNQDAIIQWHGAETEILWSKDLPEAGIYTPAHAVGVQSRDRIDYNEGIYVGYRYYDKQNIEAQFPFGYGLSYTSFELSDLEIFRTRDKIYPLSNTSTRLLEPGEWSRANSRSLRDTRQQTWNSRPTGF